MRSLRKFLVNRERHLIIALALTLSYSHVSIEHSLAADCEQIELEGHYASSLTYSGFIKCGENRPWLADPVSIEIGADLDEVYQKLIKEQPEFPPAKIYLRAKGCLSKPGSYGVRRKYKRRFDIHEIVETHLASNPPRNDCEGESNENTEATIEENSSPEEDPDSDSIVVEDAKRAQ